MTTTPNTPSATPREREVFFDATNQRILDVVEPETGAGMYSEKTAEQIAADYPKAQIVVLGWDTAHQLERGKHVTPVTAISAEYFDEMLNVLPPEDWRHTGGFEHFFVCERIYGNIVLYCVRAGTSYWKFQDEARMSTAAIVERINAGRANAA